METRRKEVVHRKTWGVAKGSSISWVVKFKGGKNSQCKLSNGWSRSDREMKLLFSAGHEWSRSYREINEHPNLPWNFIALMDFWTPLAFPENSLLCLFLCGVCTIMLQNGVSHRCACVKLGTNVGASHHFRGISNLPEKVSRDVGYRSDMGPLRSW